MQEQRTAGIAAEYIEKLGYEVTRDVGVTGFNLLMVAVAIASILLTIPAARREK